MASDPTTRFNQVEGAAREIERILRQEGLKVVTASGLAIDNLAAGRLIANRLPSAIPPEAR